MAREATHPQAPSDAVLLERWKRVWEATKAAGYEALVVAGRGIVTQYGSLLYVLGYAPVIRTGYAVIAPGSAPIGVLPTVADLLLARKAGVRDARVGGEGDVIGKRDQLAAGVAAALSDAGVTAGRVGVVGLHHIVTVGDLEGLTECAPALAFEDATALLAAIKQKKEPAEYCELEAAAAIADEGFRVLRDRIRPGATGWEIYGEVERAVRSLGAREALIFVTADGSFVARPGPEQFRVGDLVTAYVEISNANGYWVERAGLFAIGELDAPREQLARACLAAMEDASAALRPGTPAAEVAEMIERHARSIDAECGIWHGHGVGLDHDPPVIGVGETARLEAGMVMALHPTFATPDGAMGASVADTYVVDDGAPRRLSSHPQKLYRVEAT